MEIINRFCPAHDLQVRTFPCIYIPRILIESTFLHTFLYFPSRYTLSSALNTSLQQTDALIHSPSYNDFHLFINKQINLYLFVYKNVLYYVLNFQKKCFKQIFLNSVPDHFRQFRMLTLYKLYVTLVALIYPLVAGSVNMCR